MMAPITSLGERGGFYGRFWQCLSLGTISCARERWGEHRAWGGGSCPPAAPLHRARDARSWAGGHVCTPLQGKLGAVPSGSPALCPGACWHLSPLFQPSRWKEQGKKIVLPAPGGPAHSKIPACKCSWQLFKTGKCVCVKSSFPGVGRGGVKGGGLDAHLVHGQAAPPGSKQPRQGQTQAQHAAGLGSLLQGSGCRIKTFCRVLGWHHPQATAASQVPGPGCSALGWAPGGDPPWEHGDGYCGGA